MREKRGRPERSIREPDALESPVGPVERRPKARGASPETKRAPERRLGGESDVLAHGQEREDARDLERPPEPGACASERRLVRDVSAVDLDATGGRLHQPGEQVEERRLPRSVRADDADQLAVSDLERDIGDDPGAADVEPEIREWRGSVPPSATVILSD